MYIPCLVGFYHHFEHPLKCSDSMAREIGYGHLGCPWLDLGLFLLKDFGFFLDVGLFDLEHVEKGIDHLQSKLLFLSTDGNHLEYACYCLQELGLLGLA